MSKSDDSIFPSPVSLSTPAELNIPSMPIVEDNIEFEPLYGGRPPDCCNFFCCIWDMNIVRWFPSS